MDRDQLELDALTLTGGWKLLCVSTLHHAVSQLVQERSAAARTAARRIGYRRRPQLATPTEVWMEGGRGAITFEDCCEVLAVRPEVARQKINGYASRVMWR